MPWLRWQCSDREEHLPGICAWLDEAALDNTPLPLALDVSDAAWPRASTSSGCLDPVFSPNPLHSTSWDGFEAFFRAGRKRLDGDGATQLVSGTSHQARRPN